MKILDILTEDEDFGRTPVVAASYLAYFSRSHEYPKKLDREHDSEYYHKDGESFQEAVEHMKQGCRLDKNPEEHSVDIVDIDGLKVWTCWSVVDAEYDEEGTVEGDAYIGMVSPRRLQQTDVEKHMRKIEPKVYEAMDEVANQNASNAQEDADFRHMHSAARLG